MYKILDKKSLNNDVDLMVIDAPLVAKNALPGHFVILRVDEEGERIPLTIAALEGNHVTIIYQKMGQATQQLGLLEVGDTIEDFVGPLGQAAHLKEKKHVVGVAGGVGAAPLLPQLKSYHQQGTHTTLILGGRTKDHVILKDHYDFVDRLIVATDDGSEGIHGRVTDALEPLLRDDSSIDHVIAIGPVLMMEAVRDMAVAHHKSIDVSLNPIMIDGTGMCGNCRVTLGDKVKFACIDGPDFPGETVDFKELHARQNYYKQEEHACLIGVKTHD